MEKGEIKWLTGGKLNVSGNIIYENTTQPIYTLAASLVNTMASDIHLQKVKYPIYRGDCGDRYRLFIAG